MYTLVSNNNRDSEKADCIAKYILKWFLVPKGLTIWRRPKRHQQNATGKDAMLVWLERVNLPMLNVKELLLQKVLQLPGIVENYHICCMIRAIYALRFTLLHIEFPKQKLHSFKESDSLQQSCIRHSAYASFSHACIADV